MKTRSWAILMGLIVWAPWASAGTMIRQPSKDNTLFESTTGDLSDGVGPTFFIGLTGSHGARRGLMAFDLSSAPAGAVVTNVTLSVNMSKSSFLNSQFDLQLHRLTRDWGEGTSSSSGGGGPATDGDATWLFPFFSANNPPAWTNPGGDFISTPSAAVSVQFAGSYTVLSTPALVADVQSWLNNPATNFGWALTGDETTFNSAKQFDTRENTATAPTLTVTFSVPEPGAASAIAFLSITSLLRRSRTRQPA